MAVSWEEAESALGAPPRTLRRGRVRRLKENGKPLLHNHKSKQGALVDAQEQGGEQPYLKRLVTVSADNAPYNSWAEREQQGLSS